MHCLDSCLGGASVFPRSFVLHFQRHGSTSVDILQSAEHEIQHLILEVEAARRSWDLGHSEVLCISELKGPEQRIWAC